ncbi:tRNA (adenosine(37)-N6)-dimethylallyltransferase MiaA [Segetibacter aerophilus]|uniref:tRNA dimethylallyltransferase n=1 Tax=Segetibacter aerophilus TaxID=670293 RepID=A0A512B9B8_9BACT|nr:tRNA (adenosine(37)-N6)-dimethylallyltransferase MiaA [Segetibacter aerophilus]GEO08533.1 tRNA dimethylallyltransferase [Segetibacter aerophilus]
MHQNTVIIICGPTAVGKTAAAVQLAQELQTQIISADSRQCFRELNIAVAKPSKEELDTIHHYFINSHSIHEEVNAGVFEKYALEAAERIFENRPIGVMVGGTGLYIKAFTEGMDEMPFVDPLIRHEIQQSYQEKGLEYLQQQVVRHDPTFWAVAEQENPQRLMRALEIVLSSGKSITAFRQGLKESRSFNIVKIGLEIPRERLYYQINKRVDLMIKNGLVDEASQLLPQRNINALQTVGYRELFDFFDGHVSLQQAVENIKTNTRRYAKRQLTWFKKDPEIKWLDPGSDHLLQMILEQIPHNV